MGDHIAPDSPIEAAGDRHPEIRVLVTGYGPFHLRYPVNSSWSIASTLPQELPATSTCPRIKLVMPSEPIKVAYSSVMVWEEQNLNPDDFDMVLHIGLAAGRKFFTMERQSMREPYWQKEDVIGQIFSKEATEKLWPSSEFPDVLRPALDCNDIWRRWRDHVSPHLDVRPSDDPGNYLCGFIYYYTMAWYWRRQSKERPVMFLHVPDLPSEEQVAGGREVAIGLIRAMVESRASKGSPDPLKGDVLADVIAPEMVARAEEQTTTTTAEDDMAWTYRR